MPDWWGTLLIVVLGVFFFMMIVFGVVGLVIYLRRKTLGLAILVFLSVVMVPSMFASCAAINWLSDDPHHDVFGFKRPVEETGGQSRFSRRQALVENIGNYVASAHGLVSMAVAIVVGLPGMFCWKGIYKREGIEPADISGYWCTVIPLGLFFLVLLGRS